MPFEGVFSVPTKCLLWTDLGLATYNPHSGPPVDGGASTWVSLVLWQWSKRLQPITLWPVILWLRDDKCSFTRISLGKSCHLVTLVILESVCCREGCHWEVHCRNEYPERHLRECSFYIIWDKKISPQRECLLTEEFINIMKCSWILTLISSWN